MTFDEWWTKTYPDGGAAFSTAEEAWNAALEQAVYRARGYGEFGEHIAEDIKKLRTGLNVPHRKNDQ